MTPEQLVQDIAAALLDGEVDPDYPDEEPIDWESQDENRVFMDMVEHWIKEARAIRPSHHFEVTADLEVDGEAVYTSRIMISERAEWALAWSKDVFLNQYIQSELKSWSFGVYTPTTVGIPRTHPDGTTGYGHHLGPSLMTLWDTSWTGPGPFSSEEACRQFDDHITSQGRAHA